jgi:putative aldouronate transport system permease protein
MEISRGLKMRNRRYSYFRRTWMLYLMLLLPVAFFVIFRYVPMSNIVMAFKDYNLFKGTWASPWTEPWFKWFEKTFTAKDFYLSLRNTLMLNGLDLIIGFPAPIILALLMNELPFRRYKRTTQTIVYLPYFLSWIVVTSMAKELLASNNGVINIMLSDMGFSKVDFLLDKTLWVISYVALGLWKSAGWGTVIYLAAITTINPELYEAAEVDGASRFRKIWHVTLPGIKPTIAVLLIMSLGHMLGGEFDRPYALRNPKVLDVGEVISTFVYTRGIKGMQFSYTAAVGLFQSVVNVLFLLGADMLAKRAGERGIW